MCFLANKYTNLAAEESASHEREEKIQRLNVIRARSEGKIAEIER